MDEISWNNTDREITMITGRIRKMIEKLISFLLTRNEINDFSDNLNRQIDKLNRLKRNDHDYDTLIELMILSFHQIRIIANHGVHFAGLNIQNSFHYHHLINQCIYLYSILNQIWK